jgi:outer membrane protein assembly factor BamB
MLKTPWVALALFGLAQLHAGDNGGGPAWPCWRGPLGGGSQPAFDGRLIDAPDQARQVWKSEYVPKVQDAGYSSPVVAEGKAYVYYYVGDGKVTDKEAFEKLRQGRDYQTEEQHRALASPGANEVILCVDAATGRTVWKRVFESSGLNYQGSNKVGGHFTCCVAQGSVYVLNTTGILHCVDAATGEPKWQAKVAAFEKNRKLQEECVKGAVMPPFSRGRGTLPCSAPCVAEGVVCVSDHGGLVGYEAAGGKFLWRVAGSAQFDASPLVWRHQGREYFLGVGNCIEPKSGKELWKMKAAHSSGTPALEGDLLVFGGAGKDAGGASGWRLTPQKAEKLWQLPPEYVVQGNCTSPGLHRGVAYLHCSHAGGQDKGCVLAVEAATGKELARHDGIWYVKLTTSVTGMGDRVFIIQCNEQFRVFGTGKDFKELGAAAEWRAVYGNSTTPALVNGLMFFRGTDALYCYDLSAR